MAARFYCSLFAAALFTLADAAVAEPFAIELVGANLGYDQRTSEPVIEFKMSPASAGLFGQMTQKYVGHKIEMRIDGKAVMTPVVREPILGGSLQISGGFTEQQARDIAARLSSGTSKLEVEVID